MQTSLGFRYLHLLQSSKNLFSYVVTQMFISFQILMNV